MEDIRPYVIEDDEQRREREDERVERSAAPADDEVPFHIPRD